MKKNFFKFYLITFILFINFPCAYAQERIIDNAGLLNPVEKINLTNIIDSISLIYNFDLVIVTEKNIGTKTPMEFADDFFDYNGYGLGTDRDGCLFLQVTEERDYWFSTSGRGIKIFNSAVEKKLKSEIVKNLSAGNNYQAYTAFLNNWEYFLTLEAKGIRYNFIYQHNAVILIIAWLLSFGIACIVVSGWKKSMNTAIMQSQAAAYITPGSLTFKVKNDKFLYSTVTQTKIQNDDVSSGGSRSHTSSSGRSHGGGGGKY